MTSQTLRERLAELGIAWSHSRPHVSNDNPFSESLFKTIKYDVTYPVVFADLEEALAWIGAFLDRYNTQHHHSGLAGFTPNSVHDGTWTQTAERRQTLLTAHHQAQTRRYHHPPRVRTPPGTVWINKPLDESHTG